MNKKIFYACDKCNYLPILLQIDPYDIIIKYKCPIHGITIIKIKEYLNLLNNNINSNININKHLKCSKHQENNIICFNYETQEYYCIECYRLNNETGYDIRFFKDANIPNEINRDTIEYIDIDYTNNDDNIITYLINKNEHYYNIINNYYNLIKELD